MKITLRALRRLIREAYRTKTTYIPTGEDITAKKSELKYNAKPGETRTLADNEFDTQVRELSSMPEFQSIEDFVKSKIENEDETFTTLELKALVTGMLKHNPSGVSLRDVKQELTDGYGLEFIPRQPTEHVRGFGSPVHGSSPYAGNVAGSGMGTGSTGAVGFGMGGGPGAMGGGYDWNANSKRDLPMNARSKKR